MLLAYALALLLGLSSCTSEDPEPEQNTWQSVDEPAEDAQTSPLADGDSEPIADISLSDAEQVTDQFTFVGSDVQSDTEQPGDEGAGPAPCEGCPGAPCTQNGDCESGWCIQGPDGPECASLCLDDCKPGYTCKAVSNSANDLIYICVYDHLSLCNPCKFHDDCKTELGQSALNKCVPIADGSGSFCGTNCDDDDDCPTGNSCKKRELDGGEYSLCIPDAGECPCSQDAISAGAATTCWITNDFGTCESERVCKDDGLSPCTAQTPAQEVCNGVDDDCDGEIDNTDGDLDADGVVDCLDPDIDGDDILNEEDNCSHNPNPYQEDNDLDSMGDACDLDDDNDGSPDDDDCAPLDKNVFPGAAEICNSLDDNCNDETDEGFADSDGDGDSDCLDDDDDNDGLLDDADNCPLTPNGDQLDIDGNGAGDACDDDDDGDGIADTLDNCPKQSNPSQADTDNDGKGDACSNDWDGDTIVNENDNCPSDWNQEQTDTDADTLGDACDDDADGDGWTAALGDCAETDNTVYPGVTEACNGKDDNCDGKIDEEGATGCTNWYKDLDGDSFGTSESQCLCSASDSFGASNADDCDDTRKEVNPAAVETCATVYDDNCDASPNNNNALGCSTFYMDQDSDGHGTAESNCLCNAESPYTSQTADDCNDGNKLINPSAGESCNEVDDNCDNSVDEEGASGCTLFFKDSDQDGDGLATDAKCLCKATAPYLAQTSTDCDDNNGSVYNGNQEICDGADNDCDTIIDEEDAQGCTPRYKDADQDQYGTSDVKCLCSPTGSHTAAQAGDCDDGNSLINPGRQETCNTGFDDNCDQDLAHPEDGSGTLYFADNDNDSFGAGGGQQLCFPVDPFEVTNGNDCDDDNPWVHPNATEKCTDNIDNDCNNQTDEEGAALCSYYYRDNDQDSYGLAEDKSCLCGPTYPYTSSKTQDCDDNNAANYPYNQEVCDNSDNNCNYVVDEANTPDCTTYYRDQDSDGYGTMESKCLCAPDGYFKATQSNDCNDGNPNINPGKQETCSTYNIDDNCDGDYVHPDDQTGSLYYLDNDNDGFGAGEPQRLCQPLGAYKVTKGEDCNDNAIQVHPDADEVCNGVDDNCNNNTDETLTRLCSTVCGSGIESCSYGDWVGCTAQQPKTCTNYISCNTESMCVNSCPLKPSESCNGVDDDCDGSTDEYLVRSCNSDCGAGIETCSFGNWGGCTASQPKYCMNYDSCGWENMCVASCPSKPSETCNGKDDDCDGTTDEYLTQACSTSCGSGYKSCSGGSWGSCSALSPKYCTNYDTCSGEYMCVNNCPSKPTEVCDLSDNDCDGDTDEGFTGDLTQGANDFKDSWFGPQKGTYPTQKSGTIIGKLLPEGDEDWFSIKAVEDSSWSKDIQGKVTLTSPGGSYWYKVCVCWTDADPGSQKCDLSDEKCVTSYGTAASVTVKMDDSFLSEDSGFLDIRIYSVYDDASCDNWTLTWEVWE